MGEKFDRSISILGCGWLGLPLAKSLIESGYYVKGSTTQKSKLPELKKEGVEAYRIELIPEIQEEEIQEFLCSSILIINIPPGAQKHGDNFHLLQMKNLLPAIRKSPLEKILFVSSISVYGSEQGKVNEETNPLPDKPSGKVLLEVENYLRKQSPFKVTILRLAGLIGEDRHPVKFLAGKQNLSGGDVPINLIGQADCIGIIKEVLRQQVWGEIFNAAADDHTPRGIFYPQMARVFALEPPTFLNESRQRNNKIVGNQKVKKMLNYAFQYPLLASTTL